MEKIWRKSGETGENQSKTYFHHPPTIFRSCLNFRKSLFFLNFLSRVIPIQATGRTLPIQAREELGLIYTPRGQRPRRIPT